MWTFELRLKSFCVLVCSDSYQGEIEMISQMKPKSEGENQIGFLEYFEEIIGTDGYVRDINENNSKYDCLLETLS